MVKRVFIATQLNWTQLTQLNSVQPSQSCFCLWRHDLQTESTESLRSLICDSCLRCERVDNSTSSWVELSWVELCQRRYRHFADATQLNSTSSSVELCRYKQAFKGVFIATQLNSTGRRVVFSWVPLSSVELSCVAINGPLPGDAMHSADYAVTICPSVCL